MADVGRHLLGRKPSPPDLRDYRLENFQGIGESLSDLSPAQLIDLAVAELKQVQVTYRRWARTTYSDVTQTHWWKALDLLALARGFTPGPTPDDRVWEDTVVLDQGNSNHCVGFGWAAWGITAPVEDDYEDADGHAIYYEAKVVEGDPGGEDGAYTRDGAKAMQQRGRLETYAFASTMEEILGHLRSAGPIVVGTEWTEDMFLPGVSGFVKPTGRVAGGHCYLLRGVQGDDLIFRNSWGADWGMKGDFKMKIDDFQVLFDAWGEAVASVELPL